MEAITSPTRELWEGIIKHCGHATFFHSPDWVAVLEKTYPAYSNASMAFLFPSGAKALFPLMAEQERSGLFKKAKHKSMPLGVYGGVVSATTLAPEERRAIFDHLAAADIDDLKVVAPPQEDLDYPEDYKRTPLFTHVVSLENDYERLKSRFSRGQKSNIRQAQKKGVTVRRGGSAEDYQDYYHIYQETIKRWGANAGVRYPWELFLNLFEAHSPNIALWMAEEKDKPIAGVITLYCNDIILYWHGCSLQDYFDHYPNNLLHAEIIRNGCERGYTLYDLSPSGGYAGVIQFKTSFSAQRVDFTAYHWKRRKRPRWMQR